MDPLFVLLNDKRVCRTNMGVARENSYVDTSNAFSRDCVPEIDAD